MRLMTIKKRKQVAKLPVHLQSRTTDEFASRFNVEVARIPSSIKFMGGGVPAYAVTGAAVLYFLDLQEDEKLAFLREFLPRYEQIVKDRSQESLNEESPANIGGALNEGEPAEIKKVESTNLPAPLPKKPKGRRGVF